MLGVWIRLLVLMTLLTLPIMLLVTIRQGDVQPGLVGISLMLTAVSIAVGSAIDLLRWRARMYEKEETPDMADLMRERATKLAPLRLRLLAIYLVVLILAVFSRWS